MEGYNGLEKRFLEDREFHDLVNLIYGFIDRCQFTPLECRQAAFMASLRWERNHPQPTIKLPHHNRFPGIF